MMTLNRNEQHTIRVMALLPIFLASDNSSVSLTLRTYSGIIDPAGCGKILNCFNCEAQFHGSDTSEGSHR
jgi:hypothetical protein